MISIFQTEKKRYDLLTDKYICNKFGLAEFFARHYEKLHMDEEQRILDVGCGAGPLGLFLADQYKGTVTGIELNNIAYDCCVKNINKYQMSDRYIVRNVDFSKWIRQQNNETYDLIISNPPIDNRITDQVIQMYSKFDYKDLDDNSFSFLTNSWHSSEGLNLVDYIFIYAREHLPKSGSVILVVCLMDCDSFQYVIDRAIKYQFRLEKRIEGFVTPESIGAESITQQEVSTCLLQFCKGEA